MKTIVYCEICKDTGEEILFNIRRKCSCNKNKLFTINLKQGDKFRFVQIQDFNGIPITPNMTFEVIYGQYKNDSDFLTIRRNADQVEAWISRDEITEVILI